MIYNENMSFVDPNRHRPDPHYPQAGEIIWVEDQGDYLAPDAQGRAAILAAAFVQRLKQAPPFVDVTPSHTNLLMH